MRKNLICCLSRKWIGLLLLLLLSLTGGGASLKAQNAPPSDDSEGLWSRIEARLAQPEGDTARYFILYEVRNHCKDDYDCLKHNYDFVLRKLEGRFKHFAGVVVAKEMAELAEKNEDIDTQTSTIGRLSAIYGFMGNSRMQAFYQEQVLSLYEQAGNDKMVIQTVVCRMSCSTCRK